MPVNFLKRFAVARHAPSGRWRVFGRFSAPVIRLRAGRRRVAKGGNLQRYEFTRGVPHQLTWPPP